MSYFDKNMDQYSVKNVQDGFEFLISFDNSALEFSAFNATNLTIGSLNQLQAFLLQLTSPYQAITILIQPTGNKTSETGYLMALKYGEAPVITSSSQKYDKIQIFCPWGIVYLQYLAVTLTDYLILRFGGS